MGAKDGGRVGPKVWVGAGDGTTVEADDGKFVGSADGSELVGSMVGK